MIKLVGSITKDTLRANGVAMTPKKNPRPSVTLR